MIIMKSGMMMIDGSPSEVITEGTLILRSIYEKLKDDAGEDAANEILVEMGRIAVMGDLSELGIEEVSKN